MSGITSYLNNKNVYQYQNTCTVVPSGALGASGASDVSNVSGLSGMSGVSGSSGCSGASNGSSVTIIQNLGDVTKLTVNQVIELFTSGNLITSEFTKWAKSNGATSTVSIDKSAQITTVTLKYNNKMYTFRCATSAASSQLDDVAQETKTKNQLAALGFSNAEISEYFIESQNYGIIKYALKPNCGVSTIDELSKQLKKNFDDLKNQLIMQNFLNGNVTYTKNGIQYETAEALKKSDNTTVNRQNYMIYAEQIKNATGGDVDKLRQDALNKFIEDFSSGNLAYVQVSTILESIGVTGKSQKTVNGNYEIKFKYNGKEYSISCNKAAAKSGTDDVVNGVSGHLKLYTKKLSEELQTKNNYSCEFSKVLVDFALSKVDEKNLEMKDLDKAYGEIDRIINEVTSKTALAGDIYNSKQTASSLLSIYTDDNKNKSLQNEFFAFMVENSFNFEKDYDKLVVLQQTLRTALESINQKPGHDFNWTNYKQSEFNVNFSDLYKLNTGSNSTWFDEFYNILNKNISKLNATKNYENTSVLDIDALFGEKESIYPSEISNGMDDMFLSGNSSLVKFRALINQACDRMNVNYFYDEAELIKDIIQFINDEAGIENTKPVMLTRQAVEKLNDGTFFEKLKDIVNSDALREMYYFDIDGELDEYGQGLTSGACWAIGALTCLNNSPIGQQIIKDAMTFNDDGSITVTFKGADNKSYTVTKEEIEYAKDHSDGSSYGDSTMLVLLLATEKLREELGRSGNVSSSSLSMDDPGYWVYGGSTTEMIKWLTGFESLDCISEPLYRRIWKRLDEQTNEYLKYLCSGNSVQSYIQTKLEETGIDSQAYYNQVELYEQLKPYILSGDCVISLITSGAIYKFATPPNGEIVSLWGSNHAWGIKEITEDTITFTNLYYQTEYTAYTKSLIESGFSFEYTILNNDIKIFDIDIIKEDNDITDYITSNLDFNPENIQYDKTTFNDVIINEKSVNISDVLNSSVKVPINYYDMSFDNRASLLREILGKVDSAIKTIYKNMPNYTDYGALNRAYDETQSFFMDYIMRICSRSTIYEIQSLLTNGMDIEHICEMFDIALDYKTVFEKFLSFLPDNGDYSNEGIPPSLVD